MARLANLASSVLAATCMVLLVLGCAAYPRSAWANQAPATCFFIGSCEDSAGRCQNSTACAIEPPCECNVYDDEFGLPECDCYEA
jgi:hypothetical protein